MKLTDFATHVTAFLTSYLPAQRNASPNTIEAYRDAFVLLLRYCLPAAPFPPCPPSAELLLNLHPPEEKANPVL